MHPAGSGAKAESLPAIWLNEQNETDLPKAVYILTEISVQLIQTVNINWHKYIYVCFVCFANTQNLHCPGNSKLFTQLKKI